MTDTSFSELAKPKTEKKAPARQRLLTAAAEVFFEEGYSAARVSDVVARAEVAQGTFYLYFKSKEAVFVALDEMFFAELLAVTLGQTLRRNWRTPTP